MERSKVCDEIKVCLKELSSLVRTTFQTKAGQGVFQIVSVCTKLGNLKTVKSN